MGIFAPMGKLAEDITTFLKGNGLECTVQRMDDMDLICIDSGKCIRSVLPVEVNATDKETAANAAMHLKEIIGLSGSPEGYPLVVTEDRWHFQPATMQSRLLAHLRIFTQIYARNCEVRKIDKSTAAEFLNENHSYGDAKCRYRYGLYLKRHTGHNAGSMEITSGTLVAVATFSNARKWIKGDKTIRSYEWTRYASLPGIRLSGGMGRLLKVFIEDVKPDDIMTYADLEWSEGKVYETLGFVLEGVKEPVMFAIDTDCWKRTALSGDVKTSSKIRYFQNLGSNKYRLKLTDYQ